MGDQRADGNAGDGVAGRPDDGPVTLEQLIARQGSGPSGRRAARRTGEVPIPLGPGESLPAHRGPRPAVPASGNAAAPPAGPAGRPPSTDDPADVGRGLPPVPAAPPQRPVHPSEPVPPLPGGPRVHTSQPVPPLPGAGGRVHRSVPVPPLPGGGPAGGMPPVVPSPRPSAPLSPPVGSGTDVPPPRRSAPLPPIPGLDAPGRSGATAAPRPTRRAARAARRATRSPARRRLIRVATGLAALVGLVLAYHVGLYVYVDEKIQRVDALTPDGPEVIAPRLQEGAVTYLVVGTGLPGADGPAAVATLLAHVSPDKERAVLLSVPPTALVDTPACRTADGDLREPTAEPFAASLLEGGPSCMVRVVQQMSGLRVDHYLDVDLTRLPAMIDALDGVTVCLPAPTAAAAASADPLPTGTSRLDGEQAAGYLRPGDVGADVTGAAVAERAQVLLTSTLRRAMSTEVLANPVRLTQFLTRAADALTVDEQTNLGDLRALAVRLGSLSGDAVQRAALPVAQPDYVPAGSDQAYVLLDRAATRTLFTTVIDEGRLPDEVIAAEAAADEAAAAASTSGPAQAPAAEEPSATPTEQPLTVPPSEIILDVLNGTATSGLAGTVADDLRAEGFTVATVGNEPGVVERTVVRHGPGSADKARTVAAAVPGSAVQASDALGDAVQLVVGPDYQAVVPVEMGAPAPAPAGSAVDTASADETAGASTTAPEAAGPVRC